MKSRIRPLRNGDAIGKDEMNLLEYCIFSANDRVDRKTKRLVFEDFSDGRKRKLTVAFSAEYGRPTVRDDQVLVALLKLTRDQGFQSATVCFTRYEVLNILGWPSSGHYYAQIEHALDRIRGTTLSWENAYWDHRAKEWATRKFSIIDDVELLDRGRYERIRHASSEKQPKSSFRWSDVMFDSFAAGYIKTLDLETFRSIQGDVAKRLYRWLDKHFKNPNRRLPIQLPLETLAVQKLGFRQAAPSHLQRMLRPAIDELERQGIIRREQTRFSRRNRQFQVCFQPQRSLSAKTNDLPGRQPVELPLANRLVNRGVDHRTANRMAKAFPAESLRQLEIFDHRISNGWKPRLSAGGYLKEAIERQFDGPPGFKTSTQRLQDRTVVARQEEGKQKRKKQREAAADEGRKAHSARVKAVNDWRESMSESRWQELESKVLAGMSVEEITRYRMSQHEQVRVLFAHLQSKTQRRESGLNE